MSELISSTEFWFGASILLAYQASRFYELNASDPVLSRKSLTIPNLRACDFAGRAPFFGTLAAFLLVTLGVYLLFCLLSPTVIQGWAQVTGLSAGIDESVPYPLYITAAFMGLTQPGIPIFSSIGELQRNLFHFWIGVPKTVVATSGSFSTQIFVRATTKESLRSVLRKLSGDAWIGKMQPYADTVFYRAQLERLGLASPQEAPEIFAGSTRELKTLVDQLVYASALSTVRKSGGRALSRLAGDLGVSVERRETGGGAAAKIGLLFLIGMTVLWFLIPMLHPVAGAVAGGVGGSFWPQDLPGSGQYLATQVAPVLMAVAIVLLATRRQPFTAGRPKVRAHLQLVLHRQAPLFLSILFAVVVYDYVQALFDFGYFGYRYPGTVLAFFLEFLPFNILHGFIALAACFIIFAHLSRKGAGDAGVHILAVWAILMAVVVGLAAFYAKSRLMFQFGLEGGLDYVALVALLNGLAASLGLAVASMVHRFRSTEGEGEGGAAGVPGPAWDDRAPAVGA